MRITLDNIRHFQAVVRFQNLNLAAEKINISPSAVSRSIKIIEDDLSYPLFSRTGRNIVLNSEGVRFHEKSLALMENYDSLFTETQRKEFSGTYKIGASHWLASKILAEKLDDISKKNGQVKFEIFSFDSHLAVLKVLSGDLDMALCFSPKTHSELMSFEIHSGTLVLCAGRNHPLVSKNANHVLKEINQHHAIIHKENDLILSCDDHPMFLEHDIMPKFKFFWDSDLIAIELLKSGRYWSMIPDIIIEKEKSILPLELPKKWNAPYTINMIVHKDKPKHFVEAMLKAF
jgi:DNA-binding transcriptional LysR family regulator